MIKDTLISFVFVVAAIIPSGPFRPSAPRPAPEVVLPIIGHLPMPGQQLKPGCTWVYASRTKVGYLIYDANLFANEPHNINDTGVSLAMLNDNFGRRGIGDLAWCVSQFQGIGLTVVEP